MSPFLRISRRRSLSAILALMEMNRMSTSKAAPVPQAAPHSEAVMEPLAHRRLIESWAARNHALLPRTHPNHPTTF